MTTERSSEEMAAALLRSTSLEALRREVERSKGWAKVFGGFRPQSLTRPMVVGRSTAFARDAALMRSLVALYLKSIGIPEQGSLVERLVVASARPDLPEEVRETCAQLAHATTTAAQVEGPAEPTPAEPLEQPAAAPASPRPRRRAPAKTT